MADHHSFPPAFLWGAATSAYQIEGSPLADGAAPSNWHRFSHTPGNVMNDDNGDVACDHYNRWREDVALMQQLGLQSYRFSISWSRILPSGVGPVNEKGLDFYRRLVDALLAANIRPLVTLYHWDLPAALDDRGGWQNREIADWFVEYAHVVFRALDDRVQHWATLNEPWVVADGGYLHGVLAPGHRNRYEAPIVTHNLLRAHAAALSAYRAIGQHQIGLVVNLETKYAASESAADRDATRRADAYMNRQYLDPVFLGRYPEEMKEMYGDAWPEFPSSDLDSIRQPIDFLGINYYAPGWMQNDPSVMVERAKRVRQPQLTYTETEWPVFPQGLTDMLLLVKERYGSMPVYITENGSAFPDPPAAQNGRVDDPLRIAYLKDHLAAAHEAIRRGVDLRGYFAWSLLDNFEWQAGYSKRFGLVHVNYATQQRSIKASGRYYADVIRRNCV